ncbi:MAG: DUF4923 family protein [bacterium]|nr:DUF4923 family protein [bacterium]
MKKVIGGFAALAFLFVVASCGGVSESDLVGKWSVDPSSVELELGDGVPAEMKSMAKSYKKDMQQEGADEVKAMTIEFKEGGKLEVGAEGQTQEGTWSLDGENLTIGMEAEGMRVDVTLQVEMDGDNMKATLQASEILKSLKKALKAQGQEDMIKQMAGGGDVDKMAEGTSISFTLNKK